MSIEPEPPRYIGAIDIKIGDLFTTSRLRQFYALADASLWSPFPGLLWVHACQPDRPRSHGLFLSVTENVRLDHRPGRRP